MSGHFHFQTSQRKTIDLGDGMLMRWSTHADTDNVAALVSEAFKWFNGGDPWPEDEAPRANGFSRASARRLLSGQSPVMSEYDYALVVDTRREKKGETPIVACVSLHRFLMYYGCVDIPVGKPEMIATLPEYRNKGLIRKLMLEMVHPESEARGDVLQLIPGIGHFYRQFGYEYGLHCYPAGKIISPDVILPLTKDASSEPFILRQATKDDLAFINTLSSPQKRHTHAQMGFHYTPAYWQYTVHDIVQDRQNREDADRDVRIIVEASSGKSIGFTVMVHVFFKPRLEIVALEDDGMYIEVMEPVMRQLFVQTKERQERVVKERKEEREAEEKKRKPGAATAYPEDTTTKDVTAASLETESNAVPFEFAVGLHEHHPLSLLLGSKVTRPPQNIPGYLLYTRIQSYPIFIKAVASELEKRLSSSGALAGVTGRLQLDFFRKVEGSSSKGLEIVLEKGKLLDATEWTQPSPEKQLEERLALKKAGKKAPVMFSATFAPLSFTMLVTGYRSVEELQWSFGENTVKDDASRLLLNTLFPKGDHHIEPFNW